MTRPSGINGILIGLKDELHNTNLWFIDYRLRRSSDPQRARDGVRPGRAVFHAADRRFVEVRMGDQEWELARGREGGPARCALGFVERMERTSIDVYGRKRGGAWLGVLACEV